VCSVAVGTNGRLLVAFGNALAVSAGHVIVVYLGVALTACLRNVGLEGGALWIFVAEDSVRPVAALTVGRDQQTFFAQREAVNRIDVLGIDTLQAVLACHAVLVVALSACSGNVQRINSGAGISLGEDLMGASMAAGTRMIF